MRLAERVVVVTGAASGIGAACAGRLLAEGARVIQVDVRPCPESGSAIAVTGDVSAEATWAEVLRRGRAGFGPITGFVSNAFVVEDRPAHETTPESWDRQLSVNLTAAFLGFRTLCEELSSAVFVSSVHANFGLPRRPAYAASKGALVSLARQLAVEYGDRIRVNSVLPGPIETPAWDGVGSDDRRRSAEATALRRLGRPEEVARVVAFLLSDEASYVTASSLTVDGGWSAVKDSA